MNLNQLTIIGFIGKNAETKQLPNGSSITNLSVAKTKSWKDEKGEWKNKTQWHNVIAFGQGYAQMTLRLLKGTLVFVQGELSTHEYERTITVAMGNKSVEHLIQKLAVELKAETIRILQRSSNSDFSEVPNLPQKTRSHVRGPQGPNWCTAWLRMVYAIRISTLLSI